MKASGLIGVLIGVSFGALIANPALGIAGMFVAGIASIVVYEPLRHATR